jgi:hypothetical protein
LKEKTKKQKIKKLKNWKITLKIKNKIHNQK